MTTTDLPARIGKYEIRGVLGRGAMGRVYDGWDPAIGRRVAVKTIRRTDQNDDEAGEQLARFHREAQAAGRLMHPNIVAVYDAGETEDAAYIVMEFVDGQTLKQRLDAEGHLPLAESVRVMQEALAALQFSHDHGVVHRDVKPANIILARDGRVKLADFGVARIDSTAMTQDGTLIGTPAYMSPEQLKAEEVDARSDIYSAGVVLYQLLTGERPFEGGLTAIIHKALNTTAPPPSEVAVSAVPALDPVVAKAIARRPADRYQTADEFAQALRRGLAAADLPVDDATAILMRPASPPPSPSPTPPAAGRGRRPLALGAGLLVLAAIGGLAWFELGRPQVSRSVVASSPPTIGGNQPAPPASGAPTPTPPTPAAPAPAPPPRTAVAEAAPPPPPKAAPPAPQAPEGPPPAPAPLKPQAATAPPPVIAPPPSPPPAERATGAASPAPVAASGPAAPPARVAMLAPDPAAIRTDVEAAIRSARCAVPQFGVSDAGHVSISGLVGAGAPENALRQAVAKAVPGAPIEWRVTAVGLVYCDALDLIRPIAQAGSPFLSLTLRDGITRLKDNDPIIPVLGLPEFPAYLRIDYLSSDGTAEHPEPQPGDGKPLVAGTTVSTSLLGTVGPPFGQDMIIAIASSVPVTTHFRANTAEPLASYVTALRAAIEEARGRGAKITGRVLPIETVEHP